MAAVGLDMIPQEKELPASPLAPTKEEILANTSEMDDVAPLKPTKVIKMRRQTLRKRAATAANRLAGGRSTRDWDVHGIAPRTCAISASRCSEPVLRHRRASSRGEQVVGGLFFDFEAVRMLRA